MQFIEVLNRFGPAPKDEANRFVWDLKVGGAFDIPLCCRIWYAANRLAGPVGFVWKHGARGINGPGDVWVPCPDCITAGDCPRPARIVRYPIRRPKRRGRSTHGPMALSAKCSMRTG